MRTACVSVCVYDALEFVKVEERQIIKSTEQILLACSFIFPSGNYIYIYTLYVLHDFFSLCITRSISVSPRFAAVCFFAFHCALCLFLGVFFVACCSQTLLLFNKTYTLCARAFCKSYSYTQKIFIANITQKKKKMYQKKYLSKNVNQQYIATK